MRCAAWIAQNVENLLAVSKAGTTEVMARKRHPERSSISRNLTVAYSRKQKSGDDGDVSVDDEPSPAASNADVVKAALATMKIPAQTDAAPVLAARADTIVPSPTIDDASVELETEPVHARVDTVGMQISGSFGLPPEMPVVVASPIKGGVVEEPTHMPGPRDIPSGDPDDLSPPPGLVPPGDSRSLRRRSSGYEFALVYRQGNAVISRYGAVGTRGVWRVVEYPTTASASHAYAKECSRFVSEGYSDYRD